MEIAHDAVETAHQLANVGQADTPDVLQAEVEAEQAKLDYEIAQRGYAQEFRVLAALVGKPDLSIASLKGDLENPPQLKEQLLDQIVADSPSVKRAQQGIARAEAEVKSAKRESIPDLQVRAGLEQNSERLNDFGPGRVGLQGFAEAGVSLPIFNRNQGNVAAANANLERARAEVTRAKLSLRQSAAPLWQAYLSGQLEAARYQTEMIPRAERAHQLYLAKYRQMAAAYSPVLVSQRTLFQLQVAYIRVLESVWINAIALEHHALSGGLRELSDLGSR
jgi:cobalt-zinc-cadmium efflux system outer membrane protein